MRSVTFAVLAAASTIVSAQSCNPTYNVPSAGECFAKCNESAGKTFFSDWTSDPASPNFIKSLSLMCNKGSAEYMAFMTKAGMCMVSCSNPESFSQEFASACAWWQEHKNDSCGSSNGSGQTTTSQPAPSQTIAASSTPNQSASAQAKSSSNSPSSSVGPSAQSSVTAPASAASNLQVGSMVTAAVTGIVVYLLV